jgi:hypothetical protein
MLWPAMCLLFCALADTAAVGPPQEQLGHATDPAAQAALLDLDDSLTADATSEFRATFSDVNIIGQSNYTHFWMPSPLTRASPAPNSPIIVHVDLCGDGTACPPPGHPQKRSAFFMASEVGSPWNSWAGSLPLNAVIRLNDTATRGFGGLVLNTRTNTTAVLSYSDWTTDDSGRVSSRPEIFAKVTGYASISVHGSMAALFSFNPPPPPPFVSSVPLSKI